MSSSPPLYGLVLAGGRSLRMGRDKSQLVYQGERPQREVALALLRSVCERTFLSVATTDAAGAVPCIVDRYPGTGPLNAILSAFEIHPHAAWLIVACDLPFLNSTAIAALVSGRSPAHSATAFRSEFLCGPEPLCAIYEPQVGAPLKEAFEHGARCPADFLKAQSVHLLEPPAPQTLINANTPEEREAALRALASP